jgi:PRTRC genetic system protein C
MSQRIFRYGDHTVPDPGPEFTSEQVRAHLVTYFPELAKATIEEKPLPDGTIEIHFRKQVTTKGSKGIGWLVEQLQQLPVQELEPVEITAVLGHAPLTFQSLLPQADQLRACHHSLAQRLSAHWEVR